MRRTAIDGSGDIRVGNVAEPFAVGEMRHKLLSGFDFDDPRKALGIVQHLSRQSFSARQKVFAHG